MAWLGISYDGPEEEFLPNELSKYEKWLKGDRVSRTYGKNFIVIYDSNTAREFVKKIRADLTSGRIVVYTIPSILMEVRK